MSTRIALGDKVRDTLTGFEGIAVARANFLYGCERICIQPFGLHEGKIIEGQYVDEAGVELVEKGVILPAANQTQKRPAGPRPAPSRSADPVR